MPATPIREHSGFSIIIIWNNAAYPAQIAYDARIGAVIQVAEVIDVMTDG
jgi:hypothetical protein